MNWLRLEGVEAEAPEIITEGNRLIEVRVRCVPLFFDVPVCCLAQKLVKNGTKTVRYRDFTIEPFLPTWLEIVRQRFKCLSCGKTLYQAIPHIDDDHMVTSRLREALEQERVVVGTGIDLSTLLADLKAGAF